MLKSFTVLEKLEDNGLLKAEGMKDALGVVENLEGRRKGHVEAAEKTNIDFYKFHRSWIIFIHRQLKALLQIFPPCRAGS